MQHISFLSFHKILILIFLCYIATPADAQVKMATYTPLPMESTSMFLTPEYKTDGSGWTKPGTWDDPYDDDDDEGGGGGGTDKPGTWEDPYWDEEEQPIGEGWMIMGLMAATYLLWKRKQRKAKLQNEQ